MASAQTLRPGTLAVAPMFDCPVSIDFRCAVSRMPIAITQCGGTLVSAKPDPDITVGIGLREPQDCTCVGKWFFFAEPGRGSSLAGTAAALAVRSGPGHRAGHSVLLAPVDCNVSADAAPVALLVSGLVK